MELESVDFVLSTQQDIEFVKKDPFLMKKLFPPLLILENILEK